MELEIAIAIVDIVQHELIGSQVIFLDGSLT